MNRQQVAGLILAAGASSRLGQPKQLLPYKGTTLLGWVAYRLSECKELDDLVVVLGANADDVRSKVDLGELRTVVNPATGQGCSASYRVGIGACDPLIDAIVVLLGDQPAVDPSIVDDVVSTWRKQGGKIVLASYRGKRGHPMLFARELFPQMMELHGDKAVWKMVDQHPQWVVEVPVDVPAPTDINTWDDYQRLLQS